MRFMLDTDMCIYIIKQKPLAVLQQLRRMSVSDVCLSSITLSELEYGVSRSSRPAQNKVTLNRFLVPMNVVPYDDLAAREYGPLRSLLEKQGKPIGPLDTLIAAHALSLGCALVTNNEDEFNRVPRLRVTNWAK